MRKKYAVLLGGVLSLSMAQAVSASPILFDFNADNLAKTAGHAYDSVGMTVDGIGLTVSAYTIENDGAGNISALAPVTGADIGVYVSSGENLGVDLGGGDSHSMDGGSTTGDPDEGLLFSFDREVTLTYINFDYFSDPDDFNLTLVGSGGSLDTKLVDYDSHEPAMGFVSPVPGEHDEYVFDLTGKDFLFWVDGDSDSVRVDYLMVEPVHAVPAPAPLFLMGAGLLGLLCRERRRRG